MAPVSLLGALLFFLTYTEPDPETREPRPSLILRYFGGSFDIAEFDDSHLSRSVRPCRRVRMVGTSA